MKSSRHIQKKTSEMLKYKNLRETCRAFPRLHKRLGVVEAINNNYSD